MQRLSFLIIFMFFNGFRFCITKLLYSFMVNLTFIFSFLGLFQISTLWVEDFILILYKVCFHHSLILFLKPDDSKKRADRARALQISLVVKIFAFVEKRSEDTAQQTWLSASTSNGAGWEWFSFLLLTGKN